MAETDINTIGQEERDALLRPLAAYADVFLAISGGTDSTALLHLVAEWRMANSTPPVLHVLCVDHGLRPEASMEAQAVATQAAQLGLSATILTWHGNKPTTGVQAAARTARYRLMLEHIRSAAANTARAALVTAHHRDDLAETVLMRLARGAGVDGLSAIQPIIYRDGVAILRPLLDVPKSRLRASLEDAGATWVEDPSNTDQHFERVQLRSSMPAAKQLGLDSAHLALTARRMARARCALEALVNDRLRPHLASPLLSAGGVFVWPWPHDAIGDEIAIRVLMRVLPAIGGVTEPIRLMRAERLWDDMQREDFPGATLGNCIVSPAKSGSIAIYREPSRGILPTIEIDLDRPLIWDNRFEIAARHDRSCGLRVRPVARADLASFDVGATNRSLSCPIEALLATPAIDDDAGLCAIPALNMHRAGPMALAVAPFTCRFMTERLDRSAVGVPGGSDCVTS